MKHQERQGDTKATQAVGALCAFLVSFVFLFLPTALAIEPEEQLSDAALEARARALGQELRCVVCDNESIDASEAPLAGDLRRLLRERLVAGDSDEEIRALLSARYGDYILFRPRFSWRNAALWSAPFLILAVGALVLMLRARRRVEPPSPPLSAEEESEVSALLTTEPGTDEALNQRDRMR